MEKQFFKTSEAAEVIGISRTGIYKLIWQGRLASVLINGRNRRIPRASLEEFIQAESMRAVHIHEEVGQ